MRRMWVASRNREQTLAATIKEMKHSDLQLAKKWGLQIYNQEELDFDNFNKHKIIFHNL